MLSVTLGRLLKYGRFNESEGAHAVGRRRVDRRWRAYGLLAALTSLIVAAGCQAPLGSSMVAGVAEPAVIRPTVVLTRVTTVTEVPTVTYRTASSARTAAAKTTALPWWGIAVDVNHHSSLTVDLPHNDSTSTYIQPTTPIQASNATNYDNTSTGKVWAGSGLSGRTNGQIIGIQGNEAYTCSGTVIHSAAQNVIVTAGHCVWNIPVGKSHADGGAAMTQLERIWFVPGASELSRPLELDTSGLPELDAPYGIWRVDTAFTNSRWLENTWITQAGTGINQTERMHGDGSYDDVAFVTVAPLDGRQIEQVTGAQGLLFADTTLTSADLNYPTVVVGYPSASPFDGTVQRFCASTRLQTYDGDLHSRTGSIQCEMTPGSSGGAWLTGFDQVEGVGYLYGVTSRGGDSELTVALLSLALDYPLYQKVSAA